jgi:hypothetical protein
MQSPLRSQVSGWVGVAGAAGVLVSVLLLSGCPGTLDPTQFNTGTGGSNATGGSGSGTGGSNPTGGATGTGGSSGNCTGVNDGAAIVTANCATSSCHIPGPLNDGQSGGLDLTVDANIGSRLVDVTSAGTSNNGSSCVGNTEPYLKSGSNPATGLLIEKIQSSPKCTANSTCCGLPMPYPGLVLLSPQQQTCLIQWATTLTSPQ